jgi:intracellular sulfur oxidation DsrE/DsrF family protein
MNISAKNALGFALLIILSAYCISLANAEDNNEVAKVVYHVDFDNPKRLSAMIQNIFNMATTYENELMDYDIRIVFLSKGIRFLTRDNLKGTPFEADQELLDIRENIISRLTTLNTMQNVKLSLCNITRELIGLDKEQLIPGVELVTSGVVEIAKLQSQGFSYLKVE